MLRIVLQQNIIRSVLFLVQSMREMAAA